MAPRSPKKTADESVVDHPDDEVMSDEGTEVYTDTDESASAKEVLSNVKMVDTQHLLEGSGNAGQTSPASFHPRSSVAAMSPMSDRSDPTGKKQKKKSRWWHKSPDKNVAATGGMAVAGAVAGAAAGAVVVGALHGHRHQDNTDDSMEEPGRIPTRSAGMADGTAMYQSGTAEHESPQSSKGSFSYESNNRLSTRERAIANAAMLTAAASPAAAELSPRHAKSTTGDGTTTYQNETMGEWSIEEGQEETAPDLDDSNNSAARQRKMKIAMSNKKKAGKPPRSPRNKSSTPRSNKSQLTSVSAILLGETF